MEPSEGFQAFVAVYEAGSIAAGARALGVPRATVSRQLARLEERLGVRLAHRDTRRFHPTAVGEELYQRARPIVEESVRLVDNLKRLDGVPRGVLRMSTPPFAAQDRFRIDEMVSGFALAWPDVVVEVHATAEHVDLPAERFDVALRSGIQRHPDLIARTVYETDVLVVGSRGYLEEHGRPSCVEDLAKHRLLLGFDQGRHPTTSWPRRDGGQVEVSGFLSTNDIILLHTSVEKDMGLALLPELLVAHGLGEGRLESVLPDQIGTRNTLCVVYPSRNYVMPKVRVFVDHVVAWMGQFDPREDRRAASGVRPASA